MADDWLGISSSNLDSWCADFGGQFLSEALDGVGYWLCAFTHDHWFILDLGQTYKITKVRGRSDMSEFNPTDVEVYVSDNKSVWGDAVASGISQWAGMTSWVEVDTVEKNGRYILVKIVNTENVNRIIQWGGDPAFTIFDVYGDVAAVKAIRKKRAIAGFKPARVSKVGRVGL